VKLSEDFRRTLPSPVEAAQETPFMTATPSMVPQFARRASQLAAAALFTAAMASTALAVQWPVTEQQRSTANQVASAGVPLSELAPNAPDSYTVKRGDTLWDISKIFLKSPWRWPELWGMNLEQIRNPHLIYPGQVLVLEKSGGRARLRLATEVPGGTVKLTPRVRSTPLGDGAISAIPLHLIEPFLNEAVVFNTNELAAAPRVVAATEGRVLMTRGDSAYVRGDLAGARDFRLFREAKPLKDPDNGEILGYEAAYLGTAEYTRPAEESTDEKGKAQIIPATFVITGVRAEVGVGDRLSPVPAREFISYAPHPPSKPIAGRIVSIYGEALNAGQNQIVALNRGAADGIERGHVLALWRAGRVTKDETDPAKPQIKLPDERHGLLFVFRVFERVSYALIVSVQEPVRTGDKFSQP
jgi:LysM repeat protein